MTQIYRGTTVQFTTTFYDKSGAVTQPPSATVNISYIENGDLIATEVDMTPPTTPAIAWTAQWDSREVSPGLVTWSIHTGGATIPFAVQDGCFDLSANNANLPTF